MTKQSSTKLLVLYLSTILAATLAGLPAGRLEAAASPPASSTLALDAAAKALADGQLDAAASGFDAISKDASALPFVRGLALLGRAEVSLARKDFAVANATWQRVASDTGLPLLHRDMARRRMAEAQRLRQGLAGRDPAVYRAELPVLPEPAVVLHVAPTGTDTADGSEAGRLALWRRPATPCGR